MTLSPGGKQYSRSFRTKREASAFEAAEISARNNGTWIDSRGGDITFADLATRWLAMETSKRTKTKVRVKGIVQRYLLPTLGERPIGTIRTSDIQDIINEWIGADDAFIGAMCAELARDESLEHACRVAAVAGALATTVRGAVPSLPTRAAVDQFLG